MHYAQLLVTSDKGGGKCVCSRLSLCRLTRLLKNACIDLDKMLRVDCCWDMVELILTFEPDPDYSPDAGTGLLPPLSYKCYYAEFYVAKIRRIRIGRCSKVWF